MTSPFAHVLVLHGAAWGDQRHAPIFVYTIPDVLAERVALGPVSYTHLTLPTNREV